MARSRQANPPARADWPRLAAPTGTLVRLWLCPSCGYDLSGLSADGLCPECGAPRSAGTMHVGGWRDHRHVPFGGRARMRNLVASIVLAAIFAAPLWSRLGVAGTGVPLWVFGVLLAGIIFGLTLAFGGRSAAVGKRPLEMDLRPDGLFIAGHVWSNRLVPWSRFCLVRMRRLPDGLWRVHILSPFWSRHLMESLPWETGFWYVRLVFQGTRRDAALVRRVARRYVLARAQSVGAPSSADGASGSVPSAAP